MKFVYKTNNSEYIINTEPTVINKNEYVHKLRSRCTVGILKNINNENVVTKTRTLLIKGIFRMLGHDIANTSNIFQIETLIDLKYLIRL